MFERIQIVKKSPVFTVQYVLSNPHTLLLTSCDLARKVLTMVLTLKLTQEPKNAMRPHVVILVEIEALLVEIEAYWLKSRPTG